MSLSGLLEHGGTRGRSEQAQHIRLTAPPTWGARHLLTLCTAFSVTCLTLQAHPTSLFLIPEGSWGDL